jgi:predicted aldo/keto reductase-like oxidoreductase
MFRSPARIALAVLGIALVVGFGVSGAFLYQSFIGLDPSAFPLGPAIQKAAQAFAPELNRSVGGVVLAVASLLAVAVVGFFLVRSAVRARAAEVDPGRRRFLTGAGSGAGVALGSLAVGGLAAAGRTFYGVGEAGGGWADVGAKIMDRDMAFTHPEWKEGWKGSRIRDYRRFGRTEWNVSDIVLGTGRIRGEDGERIARLALDRGVNYFDTSPDYSGSGSEQAMGRAIQGVRDQLFIATKFCTPLGHLPTGTPVEDYKRAVEGSLQRLGTDYVDLCHIHSVDSVDRLMDENVHEAFDRLKQEGKVRFLGFSTHTPNLTEVVSAGIDSGRFDVMMLAYHHGLWAPIPELVKRARSEQDMGVVAMKTLKGAKHRGLQDFEPHADAYSQAALSWALSNPDVSCAVISFFELQHVDEYLHASGRPLTPSDLAILEEYDRRIAGTYCGPHCGACLDACPEGLPIHDVLRHRMYFEDYGWEKEGIRLYAQLDRNASACAGCSAPCVGSCPVGVAIPERMLGAHELLTLS